MLTLPGELVESIIDWIHFDSPSSLSACALVCREWVARTRHHHFASILLIRARDIDTVTPFLHLLRSPLATFTSSVREVLLLHRTSPATTILSAGDVILLLARSGIQPTRLELDCEFSQLGMQGAQPDSFVSVTHLGLALAKDIPLESLPTYLCSFPSLQSLSVVPRDLWSDIDSSSTTMVLPPSVHKLELNDSTMLLWLLFLGSPLAQISALVLRDMVYGNIAVNQYLTNSVVAAALTSLTFTDCYLYLEDELNFGLLDALRHLNIHRHWFRTPMATAASKVVTAIRGSSTCRPLETVEFAVHPFEFSQSEDIALWRDIDTVLATVEAWPHLRKVTIRLGSGTVDATVSRTPFGELSINMDIMERSL
ncbi:hypothetical protein C8R44DRAFT_893262 [Mycena epipterygia]|nr:hypothetical protein C8R44DRAFT_893262 [Mycena epipterygia]